MFFFPKLKAHFAKADQKRKGHRFDVRSLTHNIHGLSRKGLSILSQNSVQYLAFYNFSKICTLIHRSICELRTEYFRLFSQVWSSCQSYLYRSVLEDSFNIVERLLFLANYILSIGPHCYYRNTHWYRFCKRIPSWRWTFTKIVQALRKEIRFGKPGDIQMELNRFPFHQTSLEAWGIKITL